MLGMGWQKALSMACEVQLVWLVGRAVGAGERYPATHHRSKAGPLQKVGDTDHFALLHGCDRKSLCRRYYWDIKCEDRGLLRV